MQAVAAAFDLAATRFSGRTAPAHPPTPSAFAAYPVQRAAACYHERLGRFILPYEAVRTVDAPTKHCRPFLQSTCEAAAETGDWNRALLDYPVGHRARR